MTALSQAFATALQHHQAGDMRQAEEMCRHILKHEPHHASALNLLGVMAQRDGRKEEALAFLQQAVALCPKDASFLYNLGVAQQVIGQQAEAMSSYRQALRLSPNHVLALSNLGLAAFHLNQLEEAERSLRQALRVQPEHGPSFHNLAIVCKAQGKLDEAIECYRQAVRLIPDDVRIRLQLGLALKELGRHEQAISELQEAVRLRPDEADCHCELGNALFSQGRLDSAREHHEIALRLRPEGAVHHCNLGTTVLRAGKAQEAEILFREAIRLEPDSVLAHHNLATALAALGHLDEALQQSEAAVGIQPDFAAARNARALFWLQQGRFEEGWPEYEWRWKLPEMAAPERPEPLWDGSPLQGKTILLWAEQGLGDTLQAVRFAPLVKARGGTVIVECQAPLVRLLSRCPGIDQLVPRGSPAPAVDVQVPMMSLPRLLGIMRESLPAAEIPYLHADPALVEQWRYELEGPPSLKIGIAWQGNAQFGSDRMRSIPLRHFTPLAQVPGVRLLSLQKGVGSEQLQVVSEQFHVVDLGCRLDETTGAFMDTAAVMQNLDLVITSDTSVAHLAGGMGVPVWVALSIGCDWRYFLQREDTPWYPTMRLFRQARFGDWDEVFDRIANDLARGACQRRGESIQGVNTSPSPADLAQLWRRAFTDFQSGQREAAEQLCRELLDAEPYHGQALNLLGVLAHQAGQNELARQRLERAVAVRPKDAECHYNLGVARQVLGQMSEAAVSYRQALSFQPNNPGVLNNLGQALLSLGQVAEGCKHLERAARLKPDHVEAYINLGDAYMRTGELEKAEASLRQAVRLCPAHADSQNRLALTILQRGRLDEAFSHFQEVAQLAPAFAAVYHNLGLTLTGLGRNEEALAALDEGIRLNPNYADSHFIRAMNWLLLGDFERGWNEYEYRWQALPAFKPIGPQPLWDGSPLKGQTILLWAEQGYGDTIQFIRYAPLVKQQGGTVVVLCPAALVRLVKSCPGIDRVDSQIMAGAGYDVQAPLLSLPRIFGTALETIPASVPYLFANNDLEERWRQELSGLDGFRIGIAWQGRLTHFWDRDRSIPLRHFASLARFPGVQLISLQKEAGHEQLREVSELFQVTDLGSRLDDFADTAAVMKNLDLVITCDTSVAHLAGALGVPVWVALKFASEWRWLRNREDSPWYPNMRLFRQPRRGDWESVFSRMADELRRKIGTAAPLEVCVPVAPGELIDKITILQIKLERIRDAAKLANVRAELAELTAARQRYLSDSAELVHLSRELKAVNEALWQIEDDLRECERARDFGACFVQLARSVYQNNDRRAVLKRQINQQLGSRLIEEKSYAAY